jgi:endonuclease III
VFPRTALATHDDPDHMIEVARQLHPQRPGELDVPAWLIGRQWCGAGAPNCPNCPLAHVCPQDILRAAGIHGA